MVFSIVFCYIFECVLLAPYGRFKVFDYTLSCSERQINILPVYKMKSNIWQQEMNLFLR